MNLEEKRLRENIRKAIKIAKNNKSKLLEEEKVLRSSIRRLIRLEKKLFEKSIPDSDVPYSNSTGINVLADLLRDIVPVIKADYKKATSSQEERRSFRAHIINAAEKALLAIDMNKDAGKEEMNEETKVNLGASGDEDKFIDIRTQKEIDNEEPKDPKEEFGIKDMSSPEHIQGRNRAFDTFKKIESQIVDDYNTLAVDEDKELYFDYLIANLKLYFDMFDKEMQSPAETSEPTNQAYDDAKQQDSENPEEPIGEPSDSGDLSLDQEPEAEPEATDDQEELDLQLEGVKSKKLKSLQEKINKLAKTNPTKAKQLVKEFKSKFRK